MNYKEVYEQWLNNDFFDEETREELSNLIDEKEIEDRFYRDLEFGTGGLRGVMGAGTNRMNKYTIGKATKGLGTYLLDHYGVEVCAKKGVVIGYDTRNNSKDFSEITANVLTGMGIKVFLHSEARPTPQLSFSVKFLNALAGVVITASHNPKEYNGCMHIIRSTPERESKPPALLGFVHLRILCFFVNYFALYFLR